MMIKIFLVLVVLLPAVIAAFVPPQTQQQSRIQQHSSSSFPLYETTVASATTTTTNIDFQYIDDNNYHQIMKNDKIVLVDCCAQWYVCMVLQNVCAVVFCFAFFSFLCFRIFVLAKNSYFFNFCSSFPK